MLGLPRATEVNSRVAKEKIYSNAALTPAVREQIKDQIEAIIWRNKLAHNTIAVAPGEAVKEIQVFEVVLRQRSLDRRILPAIAKAIPYKILFILSFDKEAQAWIEAADNFYNTDWLSLDNFTLRFEGLNLDAVYENLARQVAGGRLDGESDLADAVQKDRLRQRLEREIAALEKKVLREKQFNKQIELNGELKRLRKKLKEIE